MSATQTHGALSPLSRRVGCGSPPFRKPIAFAIAYSAGLGQLSLLGAVLRKHVSKGRRMSAGPLRPVELELLRIGLHVVEGPTILQRAADYGSAPAPVVFYVFDVMVMVGETA
jgi:hypothetical protein